MTDFENYLNMLARGKQDYEVRHNQKCDGIEVTKVILTTNSHNIIMHFTANGFFWSAKTSI